MRWAIVAACVWGAAAWGDPLPSLDELLGLSEAEEAGDRTRLEVLDALDPARAELDEQLDPGQIGEALDRAARLMETTTRRLVDGQDAGVVTQRMQDDVVRLLDQVIEAAARSQGGSSGSSSQSQSEQNRASQPNQPTPSEQPGACDPEAAQMPPGSTGVEGGAGAAGAAAAWGALPERLREALMQGLSDRYSSVYERATESYYRRLAEEERP